MEASSYVCPNCGSVMEFNSEKQKMECVHCGYEATVEEVQKLYQSVHKDDFNSDTAESDMGNAADSGQRSGEFKVYRCQGCGAEILTDENTAATFCTFCGRPTLMEDRLTGELLPSYVIPFKIDREKAEHMYSMWVKKGILTPNQLKSKAMIEKITGIYVPFWLYDYNADLKMTANCTKVRHETKGDYYYTHTDHFVVDREVETDYYKIPADASEKMPDDIMDKLEPFTYSQMEKFEMPYLSGYYAEKYNYTSEQMTARIEKRVREYIHNLTRSTIKGYATVSVIGEQPRFRCLQAKYALLPVWILNYTYEGKNFMFALNGQTGKIVADRPISKKKKWGWFGGIAVTVFTILMLMGRFLG